MRKNSLAILVVFTDDGMIDNYVIYLAEHIKVIVKTLIITVNGELKESMRKKLDNCSDHVFERKNEGFDCGAYKDTLEKYFGWDKVKKFDELILLNDSCYGPIYPLEAVFEQMDKRKLDFWGITEQTPIKAGNYSNVLLPYHIQTYFVVITKGMLHSKHFSDFWNLVKLSNEYDDTVSNFELKFTHYFNARGYSSGAYVDCSAFCKSVDETQAYIFMNSFRLISEHKCPFLKKKVFLYPHDLVLSSNMGENAYKTFEYVKERTMYDEDLILQHLIRKCSPKQLYVSMHNNFCLSVEKYEGEDIFSEGVLVIANLTNCELNQRFQQYLTKLPSFIDIMYLEQDKKINIKSYRYVCYLNNQGQDNNLFTLFWDNLIASPIYIYNILNLFNNNSRLGVLAPPKPYYAHYFSERHSKNTVFPYGNMFWCRSEIFCNLIKCDEWDKEDNLAIKKLPELARQNGYMCGLVMNEEYASVYTSNYHYMLSGMVSNVLMERGIEEFKNIKKINSDLITFCEAHESIYIYGAGEYGRQCNFYLKLYGIKINGYVVTDGKRNNNVYTQDNNIYELSELEINDNVGIIIAMGKPSVCLIEKLLKERGIQEFIRYEE